MNRTHRRLLVLVAATSLVAAACGGDDDDSSGDTTLAASSEEVATTPSSISADEQSSDGSTIVVASINLPSAGFIAVHADADGAPGPVIGNSELLPAGESTDVIVTLDTPLAASGTVFPMVHIDIDGDGVYDFAPPDETTDSPGTTAGGDVALVAVLVNVA